MTRLLHFIKYNNATVLIILAIFLVGGGVFAATPTGKQVIGAKQTRVEGIDNTALLAADLDNFSMDFQIEDISQDDKYYYVTYTYLDLVKNKGAWRYQIQEKVRKVPRRLKEDLGEYLAQELAEEREARIKYLKQKQIQARQAGPQKRVEVTQYGGLIGKALDVASKVFPGYEPAKKRILPSPSLEAFTYLPKKEPVDQGSDNSVDNLTQAYLDYLAQNDPDGDKIFTNQDNCPRDYNPGQEDEDGDGKGDVCDFDEIAPPVLAASSSPSASATLTNSNNDSGQQVASSTTDLSLSDNASVASSSAEDELSATSSVGVDTDASASSTPSIVGDNATSSASLKTENEPAIISIPVATTTEVEVIEVE